jgi:hypothetical protein
MYLTLCIDNFFPLQHLLPVLVLASLPIFILEQILFYITFLLVLEGLLENKVIAHFFFIM